jgi:hypothetical protein
MKMENNEKHKKVSGMYIPPELYLNPGLTLTEMYLFPLIKDLSTSNRGCYASNHYLSTRLFFCSEQTITNSLTNLKNHKYIFIKYNKTKETGNKKAETERNIFINPDYQTLYLPLIITHTENIDNLPKEELKKLLLSEYNSIMNTIKNNYRGEHKNFYDIYNNINKEDISDKENKYFKSSKDDLMTSDEVVQPVVNNSSGKVRKRYEDDITSYSPDVQNLYELWMNLGSPIRKHQSDSKANHTALCALKKAVKKFPSDKIGDAMELYHKVISSAQDYKLNLRAPGHLVGLDEFFGFDDFTLTRIDKNNIAYGIQSWFEECSKGELYMERVYGKHKVEDENPEITIALKKYWKEYISKDVPHSPGDEDCFRLAGKKFKEFMKKNRNNVALYDNIDVKRLPRDSKYLYEAIVENTDNLKKVTPAWLCSDTMFKKRLVFYLLDQGMMDNEFDDERDTSNYANELFDALGG